MIKCNNFSRPKAANFNKNYFCILIQYLKADFQRPFLSAFNAGAEQIHSFVQLCTTVAASEPSNTFPAEPAAN